MHSILPPLMIQPEHCSYNFLMETFVSVEINSWFPCGSQTPTGKLRTR